MRLVAPQTAPSSVSSFKANILSLLREERAPTDSAVDELDDDDGTDISLRVWPTW